MRVCAAMAACAAIAACARQPPPTAQASDVYLRVDSVSSQSIDSTVGAGVVLESAARAARLPVLRTAALADGGREMRFSVSRSGMVWEPIPLLRLIELPDRVLGELYLYWGRQSDSTGQDIEPYWIAHSRSGCRVIRTVPGWAACRIDVRGGIEWRAVADSVRALRIWELPPDGVSERQGSSFTDQDLILAEVLIGDRYRSFRYYDLDRLQGEDVTWIRAAADLVTTLPAR